MHIATQQKYGPETLASCNLALSMIAYDDANAPSCHDLIGLGLIQGRTLQWGKSLKIKVVINAENFQKVIRGNAHLFHISHPPQDNSVGMAVTIHHKQMFRVKHV